MSILAASSGVNFLEDSYYQEDSYEMIKLKGLIEAYDHYEKEGVLEERPLN